MPNLSLRWKIATSVSILLVVLIATTLLFVNAQGAAYVAQQLAEEFDQSQRWIVGAEEQRLEGLRLTAGVVASFPDLKALLDNTDAATIRDFLAFYQQENQSSDLLIVLDPFGEVLARTDGLTLEPLQDVEARWVEPALSGQPASGVLRTTSGIYHAAAMPSAAGGLVFGFVIAASRIDDAFAADLRGNGGSDILILDQDVIGTTLSDAVLPFSGRAEWERAMIPDDGELYGELYGARRVELGDADGPRPLAVLLRSLERAMVPHQRIQMGLLALGFLTATAGVIGSIVLAGGVTAPLAKLAEGTRQVMKGNFDYHLDIRSSDEIGDLAASFNSMVGGLREREDMQKFVSKSTVEMIQTGADDHRGSAGERVSRTIFFSDIRGFTELSEQQPPEETVQSLNRCLSLQASLVKKFKGDVDKFVGDSVVAVFEGDDMALNAIRCAVEIQRALEEDNQANPDLPRLRIGIGIVTGEVIMGSIGSEDRLDYTAIGSNVNLCSRLCGSAAPHEILISESTYTHVQDLVKAERGDPITVKGFSQPVPVYRMLIG